MAALAAAVRVAPILSSGRFGSNPDYDDGVNFAAAALLARGVLPYRDFFYAHPPGGPLALAPFGLLARWIDAGRAFTLAGLAVVATAALTTYLLGRLCWQAWGPAAGLVAAAAYALHPEVVVAERTTFMEPVLNLACVGLATVWLGDVARSRNRAVLAGALAGVAVTLKLWALPWVAAAVLAAPREDRRAAVGRFVAGAAAAAAVVTLPFLVAAGARFFDGPLLFHLWRPPDGTLSTGARLHELLGFVPGSWRVGDGRHAGTGLLALGGLAVAAWRAAAGHGVRAGHGVQATQAGQGVQATQAGHGGARPGEPRAERFFATAYLLVGAALLAGRSYYTHYNAHLGLAEAALAGLLAGAAWRLATARPGPTRVGAPALVVVLVLAALAPSARHVRWDAHARSPELVEVGAAVRALPADACILPFEPVWAFAGGRAPSVPARGPTVIDPYGAMIFDAVNEGARFDHLGALFADERSQRDITEAMAACRFVILGARGEAQLSEATKAWLRSGFAPVDAPGGVWRRLGP